MNDTDRQLHMAAQYLAAAGKNYVENQSDDSHTNLGWTDGTASFVSHKFSNGDSLELNTCAMALKWNGKNGGTFNLVGAQHKDVLQWLNAIAKKNGLGAFVFDLHYSIDSGKFTDNLTYPAVDGERCQQLATFRSLAYASCEQVLKDLDLKSHVRTWPHHFDTGAYASIPNTEIGVGFGMAIPDNMSNDHYLYASGYKGQDGMSTEGFPALRKGEWKNGDWKGGLLSVNGLHRSGYELFFKEAIAAFIADHKSNDRSMSDK